MTVQTFGSFLLNDVLPPEAQISGVVTKKELQSTLTRLAKSDPEKYLQTVQDVKRLGDQVATWEGISVGLDDISPDYKNVTPILKDALGQIRTAKTDDERRDILYKTEDKVLKATANHPSDMAVMARSGGRGSIAQLMKTVSSPVVAGAADGKAAPWLITRSYAQGLSPAETWVTGSEARRNAIASTGSVVEPGAVAKVVVSNMEDMVITTEDCGSRGGLFKPIDDKNVLDRYLAKDTGGMPRNTLLTPKVVQDLTKAGLKDIEVRSPMTCNAQDGVCQRCMGQNVYGNDFSIGTNVGMRSAQALTEPLTQFALNAKHGVRLVGGKSTELTGLKGFRTLTEVPESFLQKATLAKKDGVVTKIEKAPQGGTYISVGNTQHYAPPGLAPLVKVKDKVEWGDALSDGTPMPDKVVEAKGVGEGRRYLSDSLNNLYARQGVQIDHRHTELLARKAMNYVQVEHDPTNTLLEGDVVPFDRVRQLYTRDTETIPVQSAKGKYLGEAVHHLTEGTLLTNHTIKQLADQGVTTVTVAKTAPTVTPVMKSIIQTPLMSEDWMSRLSHRYLKKTLVEGAGFGAVSDTASTNPVSAYVANPNFGHRADGKYASYNELAECFGMTETEYLEKLAARGAIGRAGGRFLSKANQVLFGKGAKGFAADMAAANAAGTPRVQVIRNKGFMGGGIDYDAARAHQMSKKMDPEYFRKLNLTDHAGEFSEAGRLRLEALQSVTGAKGKKGSPVPSTFSPAQLDTLTRAGFSADDLTPQMYSELMKTKTRANSRGLDFFRTLSVGPAPIEIAKQRFSRGGLLGRGGIFLGDMGASPELLRSWDRLRDSSQTFGTRAKSLGGVAFHGGADLVGNKYFTYGAPATGVYNAALAKKEDPEESRTLGVVRALGESASWAAAGPMGITGSMGVSNLTIPGIDKAMAAISPSARQHIEMERADEEGARKHNTSVEAYKNYRRTQTARRKEQERLAREEEARRQGWWGQTKHQFQSQVAGEAERLKTTSRYQLWKERREERAPIVKDYATRAQRVLKSDPDVESLFAKKTPLPPQSSRGYVSPYPHNNQSFPYITNTPSPYQDR